MTYKKLDETDKNYVLSELKQGPELRHLESAIVDEKSVVYGCWDRRNLSAVAGIIYLDVDSLHFGFDIGKLIYIEKSPTTRMKEVFRLLLADALKQGFLHITAKSSSENVLHIRLLEELGFHVVVCNIMLARQIIDKEDISYERSIIRDAVPSYLPILRLIAARAFSNNTRFHLDQHLSDQKSTELHVLWIENLLKDEQVKVWCAEIDSKIAGFVTCKVMDSGDIEEGKKGYIELIAVDKDYHRRGVGSSLIKAAISYLKGRASVAIVDTESINYEALRLYQKNKFFITGSRFIFHKWLGRDRV